MEQSNCLEHPTMTTLLCAIGALVILIYCAFVAVYVGSVAEREEY